VEISQVLVRMNGDEEGREPPEDAPAAEEE